MLAVAGMEHNIQLGWLLWFVQEGTAEQNWPTCPVQLQQWPQQLCRLLLLRLLALRQNCLPAVPAAKVTSKSH